MSVGVCMCLYTVPVCMPVCTCAGNGVVLLGDEAAGFPGARQVVVVLLVACPP